MGWGTLSCGQLLGMGGRERDFLLGSNIKGMFIDLSSSLRGVRNLGPTKFVAC